MKRLLKTKEAAEVLSVTDYRMNELRREGHVPYVLLGERQYRFVEEQLLEWALRGGNRAEFSQSRNAALAAQKSR